MANKYEGLEEGAASAPAPKKNKYEGLEEGAASAPAPRKGEKAGESQNIIERAVAGIGEAVPFDMAGGLQRGLESAGLGTMQLGTQIAGIPQAIGGMITGEGSADTLPARTQRALAKAASGVEAEGKGKGFAPWLTEAATETLFSPGSALNVGGQIASLPIRLGVQSAAQEMTAPSTDPEQGIIGKTGRSIVGGLTGATLGKVGQEGYRAVKGALTPTTAGEIAKKAGLEIPYPSGMEQALGYGKSGLDKAIGYGKQQLGKLKGAEAAPKIETGKAEEDAVHAARVMGVPVADKSPKAIYKAIDDWVKGKTTSIADAMSPEGKSLAGVDQNARKAGWLKNNIAVSKRYNEVSQQVDSLYNKVRELGEREAIPVGNLESKVGEIREKMEKFSEENLSDAYKQALAKFRRFEGELANVREMGSGTISAGKLSEIKQALNEMYTSSSAEVRKSAPYAELKRTVEEEIKKTSPAFQQAIAQADSAHAEKARVFHDNTVLSPLWKPEDARALASIGKTTTRPPAEVSERLYKILDKIDNAPTMDAIEEALGRRSPEFRAVQSAKVHQILGDAGLDFATLAQGTPEADMIEKGLAGNPEAQAAFAEMREVVRHMNERGAKATTPELLEGTEGAIKVGLGHLLNFPVHPFRTIAKVAMQASGKEPATKAAIGLKRYAKSLQPTRVLTPTQQTGLERVLRPVAGVTGREVSETGERR